MQALRFYNTRGEGKENLSIPTKLSTATIDIIVMVADAAMKGLVMDVRLVMFKPNGQRKDFEITKDLTVIGRSEDCTLRIPLSNISRKHCELIKDEQGIRVRDLASSNGTYVNNRRVNEAVLNPGDKLMVGPVVFTVQIDGVPEEITPVETKITETKPQGKQEEVIELADEEEIIPEITEEEEIDPIKALEALASESEEQENEQDDKKKQK